MTYSCIRFEREGAVAWLKLDRPPVNALCDQMVTELAAAAHELSTDRSVRVLVIAGNGPRGFAAGSDINELQATPGTFAAAEKFRRWQQAFSALEALPQPVIASIHGFCLGGGLELALAADLRIAGAGARFALPETGLGIIPGAGGTQRLARLVGPARAKWMILTGRWLAADEALAAGLVDQVEADKDLAAATAALAAEIAANAPLAVAAAKQAINQGLETDLSTGMSLEAGLCGVLFGTADKAEGVGAFLGKRRPVFQAK